MPTRKKYRVISETNKTTKYLVEHFVESDKFTCECPAFKFSKVGSECKHIKKVRDYINAKH